MWKSGVDDVWSFLSCSLSYFLRQGLSLNLKFTHPARLTGQQAPCLCLPSARTTDMSVRPTVTWVLGGRGLNSGPCAYRRALHHQSSPAQKLCKRIENIPLTVSRGL